MNRKIPTKDCPVEQVMDTRGTKAFAKLPCWPLKAAVETVIRRKTWGRILDVEREPIYLAALGAVLNDQIAHMGYQQDIQDHMVEPDSFVRWALSNGHSVKPDYRSLGLDDGRQSNAVDAPVKKATDARISPNKPKQVTSAVQSTGEAETSIPPSHQLAIYPKQWRDLTLDFKSNYEVVIRWKSKKVTRTCEAFGLVMSSGKPNAAWRTLREFGRGGGFIPDKRNKGWHSATGRQLTLANGKLKAFFGLDSSPIAHVKHHPEENCPGWLCGFNAPSTD